MEHLPQKIMTFLMFEGKAEEAMNYYLSVFDHAEILYIHRYGANDEYGLYNSLIAQAGSTRDVPAQEYSS